MFERVGRRKVGREERQRQRQTEIVRDRETYTMK